MQVSEDVCDFLIEQKLPEEENILSDLEDLANDKEKERTRLEGECDTKERFNKRKKAEMAFAGKAEAKKELDRINERIRSLKGDIKEAETKESRLRQEQMGLTYMFITHNLSVVRHISTEIAVMYLGQCVEYAFAQTRYGKNFR